MWLGMSVLDMGFLDGADGIGNEEGKLKVEKKWLLYATMLMDDWQWKRGKW